MMMKSLLTMVMMASFAVAQKPNMVSASGGKVKQSVLFDGQMFVLKFIDQNQVVALNEYYLRDEDPKNWTQMLSVAVYKTQATPGAMARNMEQGLLKAHPDAPHQVMATPDDSQALMMCVNWDTDRKTGSEFAVYRFQKAAGGVLAYQVSLRPYQAKITTEEYKALKDRWAQKIQTGKFPDVTMQMP